MIANYDLASRMPTYDFFPWMCHVKLLGATAVNFDICAPKFSLEHKGWPRQETLRRFSNFIEPGPALLGLPSRISTEGDRTVGSIWMQDIWADCQRLGQDMPRLKSVYLPEQVDYTVTIRHSFWKPGKNSDAVLWREFARRIGARVIEDHEEESIGLYSRMALYAGARMNFGVCNGPLFICFFSDYPVTVFSDPDDKVLNKDWAKHEMGVGSQMPWMRANQHLVWEKPTMENLMREYECASATT